MNIWSLDSKESVELINKYNTSVDLSLKLWFESGWYFCSWVGIVKATTQKQSSKQLLPKFSSEAFLKIGVFKNFATGRHLYWSLFLIKLQA